MSSRKVVSEFGYTPGRWEWDGSLLNSRYSTADGSIMDWDSVVVALSRAAKYHLRDSDASLIKEAPNMYEVLNTVLSEIQAMTYDDEGILEGLENMIMECLWPIDEEIIKIKGMK